MSLLRRITLSAAICGMLGACANTEPLGASSGGGADAADDTGGAARDVGSGLDATGLDTTPLDADPGADDGDAAGPTDDASVGDAGADGDNAADGGDALGVDAGEADSDAEVEDASSDAGAECGDGVLDEGEECDDGNAVDGDGCTAGCVIEAPPESTVQGGYSTPDRAAESTAPGNLLAIPVTVTEAFTLTELAVSFTTVDHTGRLALYEDLAGVPSALVAGTGVVTMVAGANVVPVTGPVSIAPGDYWLAYVLDGPPIAYIDTVSRPASTGWYFRSAVSASGPLPDPFGSGSSFAYDWVAAVWMLGY